MSDVITSINQQLDSEADRLRSIVTDLESKLIEAKAELERVETARTALSGKAKPATKKPKASKQSKQSKPAPTKEHVGELIAALLNRHGAVEEKKLEATIAKLLVDGGHSKMGFALRFKEALATGRFVDSPAGWKLAEPDSEPAAVPLDVTSG